MVISNAAINIVRSHVSTDKAKPRKDFNTEHDLNPITQNQNDHHLCFPLIVPRKLVKAIDHFNVKWQGPIILMLRMIKTTG